MYSWITARGLGNVNVEFTAIGRCSGLWSRYLGGNKVGSGLGFEFGSGDGAGVGSGAGSGVGSGVRAKVGLGVGSGGANVGEGVGSGCGGLAGNEIRTGVGSLLVLASCCSLYTALPVWLVSANTTCVLFAGKLFKSASLVVSSTVFERSDQPTRREMIKVIATVGSRWMSVIIILSCSSSFRISSNLISFCRCWFSLLLFVVSRSFQRPGVCNDYMTQ